MQPTHELLLICRRPEQRQRLEDNLRNEHHAAFFARDYHWEIQGNHLAKDVICIAIESHGYEVSPHLTETVRHILSVAARYDIQEISTFVADFKPFKNKVIRVEYELVSLKDEGDGEFPVLAQGSAIEGLNCLEFAH